MPVSLSDVEIQDLLKQSKVLPQDFQQRIRLKAKQGHKERELDVSGDIGSQFRIILRQSDLNPLDFSVILAYMPPNSNQLFRLRRYNGKSHEHTNKIEGETFYDFHVHTASERYQAMGLREDAYAAPTAAFADFDGAVDCLVAECGFLIPPAQQGKLF